MKRKTMAGRRTNGWSARWGRLMVAVIAVMIAPERVQAEWLPVTAGPHDWTNVNHWASGNINGVLLPADYSGVAQTIYTPANMNLDFGISTLHTNLTTLQLRPASGSTTLTLNGDIVYATANTKWENRLLIGGTASLPVNLPLVNDLTIRVGTDTAGGSLVILANTVSGSGKGMVKVGQSRLVLEGANTWDGSLAIEAGRVSLMGLNGALATTNILVKRGSDNPTQWGMLELDNSGNSFASGNYLSSWAGKNFLPDTARIELQGGWLSYRGHRETTAVSTETVGDVLLTSGMSRLGVLLWSTIATLAGDDLLREAGVTLVAGGGNANSSAVGSQPSLGLGGTVNETRITFNTINGASPAAAMVNGIIPWAVEANARTANTGFANRFLGYNADYGFTPKVPDATNNLHAGATANVLINNNPTLSEHVTINSLALYLSSITKSGSPTLTLTAGAISYQPDSNGAGTRTIAPNLDFNGREAIIFADQTSLGIAGEMSNTGGNGLTFSGYGQSNQADPARLLLSGANTYTGTTRVNSGILAVNASGLPSHSPVLVNDAGIFDVQGNNVQMASLTGEGSVNFHYFAAARTVLANTLTIGGDNTSTEFKGSIRPSNRDATVSGCNLVKTGSGTLVLAGVNPYSGSTTVNQGTLLVNGSIASDAAVQTDAVLGGIGAIGGSVSVAAGGRLTAGPTNAVGTLSIGGDLALETGAVLSVALGGGETGRLAVSGTVNLDADSAGGATLQITSVGPITGNQQYVVLQSGEPILGTFASHTVQVEGQTLAISYEGNDIVLSVLPRGTVIAIR